jgi:CDP-diacylglycerol--glycerol-3-phosphate 3-phosphatidyltransferase
VSGCNRIFTVPNVLTASRLLSIPVVILLSRAEFHITAACVFFAMMMTDCLDGWLAKRLRQCTNLGLYLDPVVDKIVILCIFYELGYGAGLINPAIPHLLLARELLQNAVRAVAAFQGNIVGANWMGKVKASVQTVLITWALITPALVSWCGERPWADALPAALHVAAWAVVCMAWVFFGMFAWRNRKTIT